MKHYTREDAENFRKGVDDDDDAAWQKFKAAHEAIMDESCPGWRTARSVSRAAW